MPGRSLDINLAGPPAAEDVVDVVALSWGLTSVGEGKAAFYWPDAPEARRIKQQSEEKAYNRREAVTDEWMKEALLTCGLLTNQASIKSNPITNFK